MIIIVITMFLVLIIPRSTLFPYTTLFRSQLPREPRQFHRARYGAGGDGNCYHCHGRQGLTQLLSQALPSVTMVTISVDRKSTRLNSSHQIISYAVFWLKKK